MRKKKKKTLIQKTPQNLRIVRTVKENTAEKHPRKGPLGKSGGTQGNAHSSRLICAPPECRICRKFLEDCGDLKFLTRKLKQLAQNLVFTCKTLSLSKTSKLQLGLGIRGAIRLRDIK